MTHLLSTLELIAWDLDSYAFRPAMIEQAKARESLARRATYLPAETVCDGRTKLLQQQLDDQRLRLDLQAEMQGLNWTLGVVDLRTLIAFQRRLTFRSGSDSKLVPAPSDWQALLQIAFAEPHPLVCEVDSEANAICLQSLNPNLHVRSTRNPAVPLEIHPGSPFFEVANYAGRWFLRDGYHRAYTLLRSGVFHMPAVIVHARTLAEVGATGASFFSEASLFSMHPPMLTDFLSSELTISYNRAPTTTTIRITWEEIIAPTGDIHEHLNDPR